MDVYKLKYHPVEKIAMYERNMDKVREFLLGDIFEGFAGVNGLLTRYYKTFNPSSVISIEKNKLNDGEDGTPGLVTGDNRNLIHKYRAEMYKFDLIDLDSCGYPNYLLPTAFEMMKEQCLLAVTVSTSQGVHINEQKMGESNRFWGDRLPDHTDIICSVNYLAYNSSPAKFKIDTVDFQKLNRVWRVLFICTRVADTRIAGVRGYKDEAQQRAEQIVSQLYEENCHE